MDLEVSSLIEKAKRVNEKYTNEIFGPLQKKEFMKHSKAEPHLQENVLNFLRNFAEISGLMMVGMHCFILPVQVFMTLHLNI